MVSVFFVSLCLRVFVVKSESKAPHFRMKYSQLFWSTMMTPVSITAGAPVMPALALLVEMGTG